ELEPLDRHDLSRVSSKRPSRRRPELSGETSSPPPADPQRGPLRFLWGTSGVPLGPQLPGRALLVLQLVACRHGRLEDIDVTASAVGRDLMADPGRRPGNEEGISLFL